MTDLTGLFKHAIRLKELSSFSKAVWEDTFANFVKKNNFRFLWDEEDDKWFKIGNSDELLIMAARELPLIFFAEEKLLNQFSEMYVDKFAYYFVDQPDLRIFSVDFSALNKYFTWTSDVVRAGSFSLNDLFYATH